MTLYNYIRLRKTEPGVSCTIALYTFVYMSLIGHFYVGVIYNG